MQSFVRILFLSLGIISNAEEIYVEVNEDGVPNYSDRSTSANARIEIKKPITYSDPNVLINKEKKYTGHLTADLQQANYSARIIYPVNNSAVRHNAGSLTLKVSIKPDLEQGYMAHLVSDGTVIRSISESDEIHLDNLDRGTHVFKIIIRNQSGEVIFEGTKTRITMLRHSIQN